VLVKGSNYLDVLAKLHTVVFDKTGTLTEGVFEVNGVESANGYSAEQVLAFAAKAEQYSNHPIARAIVKAFDKNGEPVSPEGVSGHGETSGSGVAARVDGRSVLVGSGRYLRAQGILPGRDGQSRSGTVPWTESMQAISLSATAFGKNRRKRFPVCAKTACAGF
jgi:Cd2+/Zn2+-exporting ATPase